MNGNGQSYAQQEEEEFLGEGMKEGRLTEEELANYTSGNYAELLRLLKYEQLQYVKNSDLLSLPVDQVVAKLNEMIEENVKRQGM